MVKIPPAVESSWKDVSSGGCGFAMATSESGKLITCGSTDDLGQSYVTSGKHCETPEPFPLPPEVCVQKAEAGWDHCVARAMKFIHGDGRNVYPQEECLDKWKEIRVK